ncbi:TPA: recombinase family protein [Pseudomonas aeruginosa]
MNTKITPDHLRRAAVVYVRQSTMAQVTGNLESQRRQYDLAGAAATTGFASVTVIDDDLGRSGSGSMERPGFERLVAQVCSGEVGAVYCIEASRLARNGRDWHHLIDLCALAGTLVIDPDGAYDPRLVNDRLLLGLKGTMSEYELSLMRQRGIAARDSKAGRGELRFMLPPGLCWSEMGKIEIDPDEHVVETIRLVFAKFRELGSGRQVFLWLRSSSGAARHPADCTLWRDILRDRYTNAAACQTRCAAFVHRTPDFPHSGLPVSLCTPSRYPS